MKVRVLFAVVVLAISSAVMADDKEISWDSLNVEQQKVLKPYAEKWNSFAPERQQLLSTGADRYSRMTPKQREEAQGRFKKWSGLPEERRNQLRQKHQQYKSLPKEELRPTLQAGLQSGEQADRCYTEVTCAEDRATVETDPSAVPGPKAKFGVVAPTAPPHFQPSSTSFLAQCDKLN